MAKRKGTTVPSRRSVLAAFGTLGIGSIAGCGSILGGDRVRWEEDGWGNVYATGETFTFQSLSTEDEPTTLRAHDPSDGSVLDEHEVDGDYAFESDGERLFAASDDRLVAFDDDLSELWSRRPDSEFWALEAGGDTVARIDHDGVLTAFDRESGDPKWDHDVLHERTLSNLVWFSFRVDEAGLVVFSTQEDDERLRRTAFSHGGEVLWHGRAGNFDTDYITSALTGDTVFTSQGERLLGFDRSNGERLWATDLRGDPSELVVANGNVYGEFDGSIIARDVSTGDRQWAEEPPEVDTSLMTRPRTAADEGGVIYSAGGETWSYDHEGNQRWHVDGAGGGDVALREDTVAVADDDALTVIRRD